ncbi:MAG: DUF2828 family protein, partial [Clostridia bacterium]|nr:DUF2828 family protein [Clostridia bacterium]
MLYPKNKAPVLDPELFKHPTSEYRGTPFWAWNGKLNKDELARQIDGFQKMGLGGFHMHVRTGLDTPYLSDEYMDYIRFCIEQAREKNMLAWMYDEDRWPSGTAGGKVTRGKPEKIRYEAVPAQAMLKYRSAFARQDSERFSQYLCEAACGMKQMHADTLF